MVLLSEFTLSRAFGEKSVEMSTGDRATARIDQGDGCPVNFGYGGNQHRTDFDRSEAQQIGGQVFSAFKGSIAGISCPPPPMPRFETAANPVSRSDAVDRSSGRSTSRCASVAHMFVDEHWRRGDVMDQRCWQGWPGLRWSAAEQSLLPSTVPLANSLSPKLTAGQRRPTSRRDRHRPFRGRPTAGRWLVEVTGTRLTWLDGRCDLLADVGRLSRRAKSCQPGPHDHFGRSCPHLDH